MSGFSLARARAVFWKDSRDLLKHWGLLGSMSGLPVVMVLVPTAVIFAYVSDAQNPELAAMAAFYDKTVAPEDAARYMVRRSLNDWFGLFLVMPVFVPILISSHSVAGEKERRTIEPLLATPITAAELVLGKSLAAVVPAVAISWLAFGLLCVGVNWAARPLLGTSALPDAMWLFGMAVVAPLFAFFGNGIAVLVSARVAESRLAQQLSALFVLPLVGLAGTTFAGLLESGPRFYAIQAAVIAVLDVGLVVAAVRLLDRDRLLSRWS